MRRSNRDEHFFRFGNANSGLSYGVEIEPRQFQFEYDFAEPVKQAAIPPSTRRCLGLKFCERPFLGWESEFPTAELPIAPC